MAFSFWYQPDQGIVFRDAIFRPIWSNACPCYPVLCVESTYEWADHDGLTIGGPNTLVAPSTITISGVYTYQVGGINHISNFTADISINCNRLKIDWSFSPLDPVHLSVVNHTWFCLNAPSPTIENFQPWSGQTVTSYYDLCDCDDLTITYTHLGAVLGKGGTYSASLPGFKVTLKVKTKYCVGEP